MKKIYALLCALVVGLALLVGPSVSASTVAEPQNIHYCGPEDGSTIKNVDNDKLKVVVQEGANCNIIDSTVKSVQAINTAHNVRVIDSTVVRGINIMGATGRVHIGQRKCAFDPTVGNNVKVTKSHDVLICYVTAKNNIMVNDNDGRITVRDSKANNIHVDRNDKYIGGRSHRNIGAIRILRNDVKNHIHAFNNHKSRTIIDKDNNVPVEVK